jgi:hypothetical protein
LQTLSYSIPYISVVLPLAFLYLTDPTEFTPIVESLFARFSADDTIPVFCQSLDRWPDTFPAYLFLRDRLHAFNTFGPDLTRMLSSTLSVVDPSDERIEPLIETIHAQLSLELEISPSRSFQSLVPSASLLVSTELLLGYLEEIESGVLDDDPSSVIAHMAAHLRKEPFPDRPFRPAMQFALRLWATAEEQSQVGVVENCRSVLKAIHGLTGHAREIYAAYDELSIDPSLRGTAEFAYAEFRRSFPEGVLPDGLKLPYSLEKATEVDKRGQLAIQEMRKLATAYDGVTHMWELIMWAPNYDVMTPFQKFNTAQKCFLVSGFRIKAREDTAEGRELRLRLIEEMEGILRIPRATPEREASETAERMAQRKKEEEERLLTPQRKTPRAGGRRALTPAKLRAAATVKDW